MMKLIGWALLTVPIWLMGAAVLSIANNEPGRSISKAAYMSSVFVFVTLWWAIYFLTTKWN